ncbi:MAG TPA: NrtA/SsuA/CpmA family ABC transporter substrate-binding protein [Candidatus Sulfotelmatobacter sp.]|nr:NrtA/SsuA/CpmA family ABC transporter substrate-binding protein [Candidatus Sulfotelmatobacter sp.]
MYRKLGLAAFAAALLFAAAPADAQTPTKMVIATGVDPSFSQFYVGKVAGLFEKHGLDVEIKTGASGSAMVPLLISNQVNAAYGSDLAGVVNHNVDANVVAVADGTYLLKWLSVVGRNIPDIAHLKGKKVGVAKGTGGEIFWAGVIKKFNLNPADYTVVNIEAPEMLAAIERGDIDAFATWEPWPTRTLQAVKGTKILVDAEGIYNNRNFIYMNRGWIEQNQDAARRFVAALCEANDLIDHDRPKAAQMVAKFLNMPLPLATELMPKVVYDMNWTDGSIDTIKDVVSLLTSQGKMKAPLDYAKYVDADLLKAVRPAAVKLTKLPRA